MDSTYILGNIVPFIAIIERAVTAYNASAWMNEDQWQQEWERIFKELVKAKTDAGLV